MVTGIIPRVLVLAYGALAYLAFVAVFVTLITFVAGIGPRGIDDGPTAPMPLALAVDVGLVLLFGASHSAMARRSFKDRWTKIVPRPMERSTYVLVASIVLALVVWQWRAIDTSIWEVTIPMARAALIALSAAGVALVLLSTFLTDHFDLFGLRQAWLYARGLPYRPVPFQERWLYRYVRHPMMLGLLVWMWAAPTMSVGHLVFALGMSTYIAVGVALEERDLDRALGDPYRAYRRRVAGWLPKVERGGRRLAKGSAEPGP